MSSPLDGGAPPALAQGAPAGAYALNGLERINLYNRNLSFSIPLVTLSGRGEAGITIPLTIDPTQWNVYTHTRLECRGGASSCAEGNRVKRFKYHPDPFSEPRGRYSPGFMEGRWVGDDPTPCPDGDQPFYGHTNTRLVFQAADGTSYQLVSREQPGKHHNFPGMDCGLCEVQELVCNMPAPRRGTVFVATDGSAAVFVSRAEIKDSLFVRDTPSANVFRPSGELWLRNGVRYQIEAGWVRSLRDRNGNALTFEYDEEGRLNRATDSLGRVVTFEYGLSLEEPYGLADVIRFGGAGGAERTIRVSQAKLGTVLATGHTLKTHEELFPELDGQYPVDGGHPYDPEVVTAVWLPDGVRAYRLQYNEYQELARVDLPTGGALEYEYGLGSAEGASSGAVGDFEWHEQAASLPDTPTVAILRAMTERRVYPDGGTGDAYGSKTTYAGYGATEVEQRGRDGEFLAWEKHYFHGSPIAALFDYMRTLSDGPDTLEGRERKTEWLDSDGNVIKTLEDTWVKAPLPGGPRVTESKTTLGGTESRRTLSHDEYNNVTETAEFGYEGELLRRVNTTYSPAHVDLTGTPGAYVVNLPVRETAGGPEGAASLVEYHYDDYESRPLVSRPGIIGHDSAFGTGFVKRGNVTLERRLRRWGEGDDAGPGQRRDQFVTVTRQYDVAGNVVNTVDPRGKVTSFHHDDSFTTGAAGPTFAFPTRTTNALGHVTRARYDYHLGLPVEVTDPNQVVTRTSYDDVLDRPTQIVQAVGTDVSRQTTVRYYDDDRRIVTSTDLKAPGDNLLETESVYDGLGRTTETRRREDGDSWIVTGRTVYDGLGRATEVFGPHRPGAVPPPTRTTYDGLGRAIEVLMPDGAKVTTSYDGNETTVTDPAGKTRKSVADALGRVTRVVEDPGGSSLETSYTFDPLGNLTQVEQGPAQERQVRMFVYDGLSRLGAATNPESGTVKYEYDANGNLTTRTDARGVVTTYTYDDVNRIRTRTYAGGPPEAGATPAAVYRYDSSGANSIGRLTSVTTTSTASVRYDAYDALGRPRLVSRTLGRQTYAVHHEYNRAGLLTGLRYPSGRWIRTDYDDAGRLKGVTGQRPGQAPVAYVVPGSVRYTAHGAVAEMDFGNGLFERTRYSADRYQPEEVGVGSRTDGLSRLHLGYTYRTPAVPQNDNNGNVLSQHITVGGRTISQAYAYDPLNRLQSATEPGGWERRYDHDRFGNRAEHAPFGPISGLSPAHIGDFDQDNNRIRGAGYDSAGNLLRDLGGSTFRYDGENRLVISTRPQSPEVTYHYDGDGRRVGKAAGPATGGVVTAYIHDVGGRLIAEYSNHAPKTKEHVYAGSRLVAVIETETRFTPVRIAVRMAATQVSETFGRVPVQLTVLTESGRPLDEAASVKIRTVPGSAQAVADFAPREDTVSFASGTPSGATQEVVIDVLNDDVVEAEETFSIEFSDVTGAVLESLSRHLIRITDASASNQPPVADAGGPYTAVPGHPLTFSGRGSSDPDGTLATYQWDFGDHETGVGPDPTHTYPADGTYVVTLRVVDNEGKTSEPATASVTVAAPNTPPLVSVDSTACHPPCSVIFTASASDPDGDALRFEWFGCGSGTGITTSCAMTSGAAVTAMVTVSDGHGVTSASKSALPANQPPAVALTGDGSSCEVPCSVTFTASASDPDGDPVTFTWTGCGTGSEPSVTCSMDEAGAVAASVRVTDSFGATVDASATAHGRGNSPPAAHAGGPYRWTAGDPLRFEGSGADEDGTIARYEWSFGDGDGADGAAVSHAFAAPGTYTARLTVTDDRGATGEAAAEVVVTAAPPREPVTWVRAANVTVSGNTITKAAGIPAGWDASAVSSQAIVSGDGYVESTAAETALGRIFGLGRGDSGRDWYDVEFGLQIRMDGTLLVREAGEPRGLPAPYRSGDVLRVSVESGVVRYLQNGRVLHTSTAPVTYPLLLDTSVNHAGASIANAFIAGSVQPNRPPTVAVAGGGSCHPYPSPCTFTFTASASDPDGDPLSLAWSGCATGSGASVTCALGQAGAATATATVTDERDGVGSGSASGQGTNQAPGCDTAGEGFKPGCGGVVPVNRWDPDGDPIQITSCTGGYEQSNGCYFEGAESGREFDFTVTVQDALGATGQCTGHVKWHDSFTKCP